MPALPRALFALICVLALAPPRVSAAAAAPCGAAATQAEMNRCAYENFLAANAEQATVIQALERRWSAAQRSRFRAVQKAWTGWRTAQCDFESSASAGGSVREFVRWDCAARMTGERTQALHRLATCHEGDVACRGLLQ